MSLRENISEEALDDFWRSVAPIQGEIWKDIVAPFGTTSDYQVSNMGRVVSLPRMRESRQKGHFNFWKGKLLKASPQASGTARVSIRYGNRSQSVHIHNLVLWAFIGPQKKGTHVRHNDGDPGNNRLDNLSYSTHYYDSSENARDSTQMNGIVVDARLQRRIEGAINGTEDPIAVLNEIRHLVIDQERR